MIESLSITNFQRHERLDIDFDKITTIVGTSDIGKSAIIRAMRWVVMNRPIGTTFMRRGAKRTSVTMKVDGTEVGRIRSKDSNTYKVNDETFRAFGADVPDAVSRVLDMSELNFQGQHEPTLWFSLSAGEVAKQLNCVIDLDAIDDTRRALTERQNEVSAELDNINKNLNEIEKELESLSQLDKIDEDLRNLERQQLECGALRSYISDLGAHVSLIEQHMQQMPIVPDTRDLDEINDDLCRLNVEINGLKPLVASGIALEAKIRNTPDISELSAVAEELYSLARTIADLRSIVNKCCEYEARIRNVPDIKALEEQRTIVSGLANEVSDLRKFISILYNAAGRQAQAARQYEEAQLEFKRAIGDTCPLCGSKLVWT